MLFLSFDSAKVRRFFVMAKKFKDFNFIEV